MKCCNSFRSFSLKSDMADAAWESIVGSDEMGFLQEKRRRHGSIECQEMGRNTSVLAILTPNTSLITQ